MRVKKQQRGLILWENKYQQYIWEVLIKEEVDTGFWSKAKFDTFPYISANSFVFPQKPGISFPPSMTSFNFISKKFLEEKGYFVAMLVKLITRYDISPQDMKRLAVHADSFISIDFKDNNTDYRRVQVSYFDPKDRNVTEDYKKMLEEEYSYFRNLGISMEDVVKTIKDEPLTVLQIRKILIRMGEITRTKVDLQEVASLSQS